MLNFISKLKAPMIGGIIGALAVGAAWSVTYEISQQHTDVVAKVGNNSITRTTLLQGTESAAGSQILAELITNQLVLDAAQKANTTATSKEIDQFLTSIEQQDGITSESQLNSVLAQSHMTKNQLMSQLKIQVLETKIAESKVSVSEKQIQDYYNKNKNSFATPEKVSLSDITVSSKAKANQIENLLKSGQSFSQLAKQYSTDTFTKNKGGAMGNFAKSDLDTSIANAAFKLNIGQASSPIQVSSGYEIVEVTAIQSAKVQPLAQAKQAIMNAIKKQNAKPSQQLVADLAKLANIQILDSRYSAVVDELKNPVPTTGTGQ